MQGSCKTKAREAPVSIVELWFMICLAGRIPRSRMAKAMVESEAGFTCYDCV